MTVSPIVVKAYCEENLENVEDKGDKLYAKCPRCGKSRKHFNVSVEEGVFHCYRCGFSGTFNFLVKFVEGRWRDAEELQEEYSTCITLDLLKSIHSGGEEQLEEFGDWTVNTVPISAKCRLARLAREYLATRNVSEEVACTFEFRVAIEGDYRNYIIIPLREDGQVKSFLARRFLGEGLRYTGPSSSDPFQKRSDFLWGLDRVKQDSHIAVVEGVFDALALKAHNAVALMGKVISDTQVEKLLDIASGVTVLLDENAEQDARKIASRFVGFLPVKVACMCKGDPAENPVEAVKKLQQAVEYL